MKLNRIKTALKPYMYFTLLPLASGAYRAYMAARCRYTALKEGNVISRDGFPVLPPAPLRYRIHGSPELDSFLAVGRQCSQAIMATLKKHGVDMDSVHDVLDFGCGCGRTLIWFTPQSGRTRFHGTDIDGEAIGWAAENLKAFSFGVNSPLPPLGYGPGAFDLVYAISVFTHLDEEYQFKWLEELNRVCRPGGMVLLTVHGRRTHGALPPVYAEKVRQDGFLYITTNITKDIFPDWYQSTYHTEEYVRRNYDRYFDVLDYVETAMGGHQDLVVLRKRADTEQA